MGLESRAKSVIGSPLCDELEEISSQSGHTRFYFRTQTARDQSFTKLRASKSFNPVKIGKRVIGFQPFLS